MDIVLEVIDTLFLDRFWVAVHPSSSAGRLSSPNTDSYYVPTSTFSSMREAPTQLQPATKFFQLEPTQYAFMSEWPRDNPYRQGISLFFITWYYARPESMPLTIDH